MRFSSILKKAGAYLPALDERRLLRAYNFAKKAHKGQKRRDGQAYLVHPVAVAEILTELYADEDTLIAALLHDTVEDTAFTPGHIRKLFGQKVVELVDGVTMLNKAQYPLDNTTRKMESLKKFFRLSNRDLRVITIKLADRLHNMRTVKALPEKRRIKLATETMDIYIPIANLLGIWKVKSELEDLSFECLKPAQYQKIFALYDNYLAETKEARVKTIEYLFNALKQNGLKARIIPQDISLFAHYRKSGSGNGNREESFRSLSFNVIVPKKSDCYCALGILHSIFKPRYSKIKDYIATPKANNYRSLHTVVFGIKGLPTSFRIRTLQMHRINEYGMLSNIHRLSLDNPKKASSFLKKQTKWLQKVLEISDELPSDLNFLNSLKMDVLNNRIFAFTPRGDLIDLPEGATVLDFAYAVGTDFGNMALSAEIDGNSFPLSQQLQTGDTVKIMVSEKQSPRLEWLNMVRTNEARQKIKSYFREKDSEKSFKAGKRLLEESIRHLQKKNLRDIPAEKIKKAVSRFKANDLRELLVMIGKGEILARTVLNELFSGNEIFAGKTNGKNRKSPRTCHPVSVLIEYRDRIGLFRDIAATVLRFNVNIIKISVKTPETKSKKGVMELILGISGLDQLMDVFTALEQIDNITYVHKK